ncbi:hypothetical protein ACFE04_024084 [Oxalis oulophora]
MSGRNRGPPLPVNNGMPHHHAAAAGGGGGMPMPLHGHELPPYARGGGGGGGGHMPLPPHRLDDMRESQFGGMGPRPMPPHPAIIEERLAAQHQDIQGLLADNQRLAATHVALKQELEAAQHELQRTANFADSLRAEKDTQMREIYEKSVQLEVDLRGVEAMRAELVHVRADTQELANVRKDLTGQIQLMTQDLTRMTTDLHQVPALKGEIDNMRQELQRTRSAIEYEKKGYAENYEHGQSMEKNLVTMARELEKLRSEVSNAEKRAQAHASATAAVAIPEYPPEPDLGKREEELKSIVGSRARRLLAMGAGYNVNYGNPEAGYVGNPYPANYGMNPVQAGAEGYAQYPPGPAWGAYGAQGQR